ncbi:MAG TPA: hypothetical protein VLS49_11890 [Usitatibacter sp.]|nr:hypothetical protein [Usitatibacter sp.]
MITFHSTCPNGHTGSHSFYKERLGELLDSGELRLWCVKCDTQWDVPSDEREGLRRLMRLHM